MSGIDRVIFLVNLGGAVTAALINGWAVVRPGPFHEWRPLRAATAALAAFYAVGYVAVLSGVVDVLVWSQFFRGVSPVAWLLVWCGPVLTSALVWRKAQRAARGAVEKMHQEAEARGR